MLEYVPFAIIVVASFMYANRHKKMVELLLESVKEVRKMMQDMVVLHTEMQAWQQQRFENKTILYMSKKSNKIHFAGCHHIKDIKDISEYELCLDCIKKR